MKKTLSNILYRRKRILIAVAALIAACVYGFFSHNAAPPPDYVVGIVSPQIPGDAAIEALRGALCAAGQDLNGDGVVHVDVRVYAFAPGQDGQDATQIAALDADLVGKRSGMFLVADRKAFDEATGSVCQEADTDAYPALSAILGQKLVLTLRPDHPQAPAYRSLAETLLQTPG